MVDVIPPDRLSENRDALFDIGRRNRGKGIAGDVARTTLRDGAGSRRFSVPTRRLPDLRLRDAEGDTGEFHGDPGSGRQRRPSFSTRWVRATARLVRAWLRAPGIRRGFRGCRLPAGPLCARRSGEPECRGKPASASNPPSRAFPRSPAIATRIGNLYRMWEDWTPALAAFDAALSGAPGHPEATIGRAISLSRLERSEEAIAAATRLIDGGQWLLGEAYYWRGWNHLRLNDFQLARADADRARTLMSNSAVLVLSGVIEWRLGRLESAEKDFEGALAIDLGECEAAFDLGVVRDQLGRAARGPCRLQAGRPVLRPLDRAAPRSHRQDSQWKRDGDTQGTRLGATRTRPRRSHRTAARSHPRRRRHRKGRRPSAVP